ncbi:MAG TPA: DUF4446 family protein [Anaerolineae bacterium]|nr:DUF4446 family protein [Anaerolineae bacterium]
MGTVLIWSVALTILVIVGIVWILDLQARLSRLQRRYEGLLSGDEEDASLEVKVGNLAARLAEVAEHAERVAARTAQLDAALTRAVQGVGLVRYRAYKDTGGDQSFSLALVDGEGNGAVISALYGREVTRVYAKPIQGWLSPKPLSDEEKQALAAARQTVVAEEG